MKNIVKIIIYLAIFLIALVTICNKIAYGYFAYSVGDWLNNGNIVNYILNSKIINSEKDARVANKLLYTNYVPTTAQKVFFFKDSFTDFQYLKFIDKKPSIDKFASQFLGYNPIFIEQEFATRNPAPHIPWWYMKISRGYRAGEADRTKGKSGSIVIFDEGTHSTIWVFRR